MDRDISTPSHEAQPQKDLNVSDVSIEDLVARTPGDAECSELFNATLRQLKITPSSSGGLNQGSNGASAMNDEAPTPEMLNELGNSLMSRFQHLGELADADRAIESYRTAIALTLPSSLNLYVSLSALATALLLRFERLGELRDLDHATCLLRQSACLLTSDDPRMPSSLDALGICLISRFERYGQISDLEQAVSCFKLNMSLVPEGHPDKSKYWSHLGRALTCQFDYLGDLLDLSIAIESYSQALALSSDAGAHKAEQFARLGQLYMSRFQRLGDQADLNRSVENRELALTLVPEDHPGRAGCLSALGDALVICFESTGEVLHLDQAVGYYNEAIMSTPAPHVNRPAYQKNLADTLSLRANHLKVNPNQASQIVDFQQLGGSSDVEASIQQYQQAAEAVESPFVRFGAALSWARLSFPSQMPSALQGYQQVMNIIPQRVWLGSPGETWKRDLQEVSPVMAEAAAAAIQAQSYDLALEWMEQARLATWKATMQLRASIDSLRSIDTMLAEHIQMVAHELNNPTNEKTELSLQRTRRLAEQFESLTLQARSLPGLERFMRIAKAAELMRAAHSGAVVVINAYTTRCDALVILPHSESTVHVPLPSFSYDKADQALSQLAALTHREVSSEVGQAQGEGTFESILAMLWGDVVKPVLDTVEYTKPTSASELPHIIWCPTGPLALLPLHAAGLYGEPNSKIYDYVVSSYTPDLTSLLPSTRSLGSFKGIVGVSQALDKSNMTISKGTNELDEIAKRVD